MTHYVSPEAWGASLTPPIGKRRAQALCESRRVQGARRRVVGGRASWEVPEGAPDPRKAMGRPRKAKD